jgi:hypothetical protein
MGADKNSSRRRCLLQQDEHGLNPKSPSPLTSHVCQDHITTGVLLILGANHTSKQLNYTQHAAEKLLLVLYRSYQWCAPVRPVRPVNCAGQTGGHNDRTEMF